MPILDTNEAITNVDTITPDRKLYTRPDFKTSTLFADDHELDTIIQYVEGSKWTVDYFKQIREINDEALMPDINVSSTTLKYDRINKLIIFLSSAINQDDPDNITGEATINAGFLPSYGDPFIATLAGSREAIFVVTSVNKKMYSLHDVYEIEFKLFAFLDRDSLLYRDLLAKTMKEYIYDKDYVESKSSPIILAQDYKEKLNYKQVFETVRDYYFTNMFNKEKRVISLPTITGVTYLDQYIMEFLYKIVGYSGYPNSNLINRFNITLDINRTIWDLLLERNKTDLPFIKRDIDFVDIPYSTSNPTMRHMGWLGIDFITGEINPDYVVDYSIDIKENDIPIPADFQDPIIADETDYIFSPAFYVEDVDNCGILEKAVLQYLRNEVIDDEVMNTLIAQYRYWSTLDQFRLIPVLMLLIKDKINNTFSPI